MGKIGDLFVKLGLKNEEFKAKMSESKNAVESFKTKAKSVSASVKVFWAAIGATAAKVIADIIRGSQRYGDAWAITTSKAQAAWHQFVTTLTNWNWEGFGERMRKAMSAAGKSTAAHDAEFEVENSLKIRKAAMREELEDLQVIARSTNKSYEERKRAADAYLAAIKPLYEEEAELRRKIYEADTDKYLAAAGLSTTADNRDALVEFLTRIAPDGDLVSALENYSKRNRGAKNYNYTSSMSALIDGLGGQYSNNQIAAFATLAEYYQGNNKGDAMAKEATDAIVGYFAEKGAYVAETKRMQVLSNSMDGQIEDTAEAITGNGLADVDAAFANAEAIAAEKARENAEAVREWKEALTELDDALKTDQEDLQEFLDTVQDELSGEFMDDSEAKILKLKDLVSQALSTAINDFADTMQTLFDALATGEDMDSSALAETLLTPLCDMAKQMGTVVMAMGAAMIEIEKDMLVNPAAVIAAGAALVAIGAAGKAALSAITSGSSATSTTTTGTSTAAATTSSAELTVYVKGTIKGSDILISGQNTMTEWSK